MSAEAATIVELAKLSLQLYFAHMALAGKTDEEVAEFYEEQKTSFKLRNPSELNPVPEPAEGE